jgi:hypothetical protein
MYVWVFVVEYVQYHRVIYLSLPIVGTELSGGGMVVTFIFVFDFSFLILSTSSRNVFFEQIDKVTVTKLYMY